MNATRHFSRISLLCAAISLAFIFGGVWRASAVHIFFTNATINGIALETSAGFANPTVYVPIGQPITFGVQAYNVASSDSDTLSATFAAGGGSTLAAPATGSLSYPGGYTAAAPYSFSFTRSFATAGTFSGSVTVDFPVSSPDYVVPGSATGVNGRNFPFTVLVNDNSFNDGFGEYVSVGNPVNGNDPTTGYGAVAYNYTIGKYEVTQRW